MSHDIFIVNRNRLSSTRKLVEWLHSAQDVGRIIVVDNASTYEPLLDWYSKPDGFAVHYTGNNRGPQVPWLDCLMQGVTTEYVVTDSDIVPSDCCPKDLLPVLRSTLAAHPNRYKVGPSLRTDNLVVPYRQQVINENAHHWVERVSPACFLAGIDTTFAMYRPNCQSFIPPDPSFSLRMDFPYVAEHWPWYIWPLTEEEKYYREHCEGTFSNIVGYGLSYEVSPIEGVTNEATQSSGSGGFDAGCDYIRS